MRLSEFEAIIFDSDGVLVDSEAINIDVERELLAELGLRYAREDYLTRFVGLSNPDFYSQLRSDYAELKSGEFPTNFSELLHGRLWPRIEAELKPIEGVDLLVGAFKGKVAVGSSAPFERLLRKLTITNLADLFLPHIYSADHVRNGKPEPDLFLHAAEQLNVAANRCVVIEDSAHGVMAARAAGMVPIGFTGGGHADEALRQRLLECGAEMAVSHHSEIQALL